MMKIRLLWTKWFSWSTISHWLIILCLWAASAQIMYPTLDSLNFMGWLNASVLALCAVTLALRLFLPKRITTGSSTINRCFFAVDVLVLTFISYGVLLNVNGVMDSSAPETKSAVITEVIEDPFSPSWFFPAGRSLLTSSNVAENPKYIAVRRSLVESLLIGQEVTFTQYKGFLGMPWVSDFRVDYYSVPQDLLTSNDPIIKKYVALAELHKQQWERGLRDSQQYASEEPEDIDFLISATEALLKGGQAAPAVAFLKPIVTARPNYRVYTRYAELLRTMGNREEAVEILQVATTLDSKPIMALYYLGYMLKAMGRFGEATVAFEKLLEIEPDYPMIKGALQEMHQPSGVSTLSLH